MTFISLLLRLLASPHSQYSPVIQISPLALHHCSHHQVALFLEVFSLDVMDLCFFGFLQVVELDTFQLPSQSMIIQNSKCQIELCSQLLEVFQAENLKCQRLIANKVNLLYLKFSFHGLFLLFRVHALGQNNL